MLGVITKVGRGAVKHGLPLAARALPMGGPLAGMAVDKLMGKEKEEEKRLRRIIREEVAECLSSLIIRVADQLKGEDEENAPEKEASRGVAEVGGEVPAFEVPEEFVVEAEPGPEAEAVPEETPALPPGKLTANFSLSELLWSATASQKGIENTPHSPEVEENLKALCESVLQPVADHYMRAVRINSGYRSPALNAVMPGSSDRSQHCKGEAADIEIMGLSNYDLACYIRDELPFDQLILENYTQGELNSGWIHVSHGRGRDQRRSVLTMVWETVQGRRKAKYLQGLVA